MSFRRIRELRNYKKYITVWAMALTWRSSSILPVSAAPKEGGTEQKIFRKI